MPEPTIANQLKQKLFEWEFINRDEFNRGKFYNYTEDELEIINNFNKLDLNSNNVTIAFGCDDEELLGGISIWTYNRFTELVRSNTCYVNILVFEDVRYIITIDDFRPNSLILS